MKKKKILIVTINDMNCGNRLQNYASTHIFKEIFGYDSKTLNVDYGKKEYIIKYVKYIIHTFTYYRFAKEKDYWINQGPKFISYFLFDWKYIRKEYDCNSILDYDFIGIGSDQVWNPNWYESHPGIEEIFLLSNIPAKKKICISPSIGVSEITGQWQEFFRVSWEAFNHLAVREESARDIVNKICGKKAEVLIDPTLMLNKSDWEQLEKKPRGYNLNKKYVFIYFLGQLNEHRVKRIKKFAEGNNMQVYDFFKRPNGVISSNGPREFLYLIHHAELVLTDSYHSCIFAFLYNNPFWAFQREDLEKNMMTRLHSFMNMFSLFDHLVKDDSTFDFSLFHDYEYGYNRLDDERRKMKEFLRLCIEGE